MKAAVRAIQVDPGTSAMKKADLAQLCHPPIFVYPKYRLGRGNWITSDKRIARGSHAWLSEADDFTPELLNSSRERGLTGLEKCQEIGGRSWPMSQRLSNEGNALYLIADLWIWRGVQ